MPEPQNKSQTFVISSGQGVRHPPIAHGVGQITKVCEFTLEKFGGPPIQGKHGRYKASSYAVVLLC